MKIPKEYPQFKDGLHLIFICGKQEAKILSGKDGIIEGLDDFKIEHPQYSDKEGFFQTKSRDAGVLKSGAVYEDPKEETVRKDFLKGLEDRIKRFSSEKGEIVLHVFSPDYMKTDVKELFEGFFDKDIIHYYEGNFYNQDKFQPLELIKKELISGKEPKKREARKILEK